MTLTLPNLDDRTYDDLVDEAIALIPNFAPQWTNHNPSDPGITLIELFAYLTELLLYRQNQVTDDSIRAFLKLLNGPEWIQTRPLDEEISSAVLQVRQRQRAVTTQDFEQLAKNVTSVGRARCFPRRNLEASEAARQQDAPAHISVIIVPEQTARDDASAVLQPSDELRQQVVEDLDPRRLITTQVHVVGPRYVAIGVRFKLTLLEDGLPTTVRAAATQALAAYFHPLTGGPDKQGWPFGRNIYVSEIYDLLDRVPGVDYVSMIEGQDELTVIGSAGANTNNRLVRNADNELVAIALQPDELVDIRINTDGLTLESPIEPFRVL